MTASTSRFFKALALTMVLTAPSLAVAKPKAPPPSNESKKPKMEKLPFDVPSRGKPEPKTCEGRCDRDKGDCDAMCKAVQGQGAASCKKACVDVNKQCMQDCKGG